MLRPHDEASCSVASLSSLRVFRLFSKVFRSLPDEICRLSALQELHLSCPLLQQLPENFGRLTRLEHLSFKDCKEMRRLPDSLGDLSSLLSPHRRLVARGSLPASRRRAAADAAAGPTKLQRRVTRRMRKMGETRASHSGFVLRHAHSPARVHALAHASHHQLLLESPVAPSQPALRVGVAPSHDQLSQSDQRVPRAAKPAGIFGVAGGLKRRSRERFPVGLFALPSLAHADLGYVMWLEPHDVTDMENSRELADLLGHVAQNHPSAAGAAAAVAAGAAVTAAATAAAVAAVAAGARDATDHTALGPSLKHLSICLGSVGYGRNRGGRLKLSARVCSLLSLTHLLIDGLSSSAILPSDLGRLHNLRSLSLYGSCLCLPHSLSRLAPCLHSLSLHYTSDKDADTFRRELPSYLSRLTSLAHLHLRNMHVPFPRPPLRACAPSARYA
ncbi:unnamed protein product [Closterium sp. NIES-53]